MIPQEDRDETPGAQRKAPRMGATRTPLHLVFQACVGVIIGIGITSLFSGAGHAQLALAGVIVVIAAWIVMLVRTRRARFRTSACLCPACRYDLRATPGRCPECGSASHLVRQPPIV